MSKAFSAVIQAGGKSSRMGTDKALVCLNGKPLIEHVIERLRLAQPAEIVIISNASRQFAYTDVAVYEDRFKEQGPLGGILTALLKARHDNILVVACDMPFINPSLLRTIVDAQTDAPDSYDAVVPRFQGQPEGLHALYHKNALQAIERRLNNHQRRLGDLFSELNVRFIDEQEYTHLEDGRSFTNINTPDEFRAAEQEAKLAR